MRHGHLGGTPPSVYPSPRNVSRSELRSPTDSQTARPTPGIARPRSTTAATAGSSIPETLLEPPGRSDPNPFPIGERTASFRARHFHDVPDAEWNDWQWQLRDRIRDLGGLERVLELAPDERDAIEGLGGRLPVGITPYYASLMDATIPTDPLRRTMIPVGREFVRGAGEADDPLGEDARHARCPGSCIATPTACCSW